MLLRLFFVNLKSLNFGVSYQINDYVSLRLSTCMEVELQSQPTSQSIQVATLLGGKELAPVPMRRRGESETAVKRTDKNAIKNVLAADRFDVFDLNFEDNLVHITVKIQI